MDHIKMLCVIWLFTTPFSDSMSIPIGMFRTECQDRHFWLAVRSNFLGYKFRFDVKDDYSIHTVADPWAAECGYTMVLDPSGDLVVRASYLACHVENQADSEFQLLVWFVNEDIHGEETSYPLLLTCPLTQPWHRREVVCEENYMEVSVRKPIPPDDQMGTEWIHPASVGTEEGRSEWRVVFHVPVARHESGEEGNMREETVPVGMAQLLGFHVNSMVSRILLRCPYGFKYAHRTQVNGIEMEWVSATVLYKHQWTLLRVDTSVACTIRKASLEGADIVWSFPSVSPLVQSPVTSRGVRVGVEGQYLSSCMIQQRSYQTQEQNGTMEIRVPFGAEGGFVKSHVSNNEYSQSYYLDLFYLQEWEDTQWSVMQQRTFRPVSVLRLPQKPRVINSTVVSEGVFSMALGVFPSDVSLVNLTVAGQAVTVSEAGTLGLVLSRVPFPNGTHAYLLQAPFSSPLVSQQYVGDKHRRYALSVIFSLLVSPEDGVFHHPATVETYLQDVVLPRIEGECTQRGVELLLHYGNMDLDWTMYVGGERLDWELVQMAGFNIVARNDQFTVDVPLYSQGMTYEGLGMQGLLVSAEMSLVHPDIEENITYKHDCIFPVQELLVCLPDGRVVVLIDTSDAFPSIDPKWTSLLNPNCRPVVTNQSRALFTFSIENCGTIKTLKDGQLIYYNEVRYMPPYQPHMKAPSSLQLNFRIPVGCVHSTSGSRTLSIFQSRSHMSSPAPIRSRRWLRLLRPAGHWKQPVLMGHKKHNIKTGG